MGDLSDRLRNTTDEIARRDPKLAADLRQVRERAQESPAPPGALESMEPAGATAGGDLALETIVLRTARPVLAIRSDDAVPVFTAEDSVIWEARIKQAQPILRAAIRAVGRVEVKYHPSYEWIGTAWLVAPDVVVTNRHVAREFARRKGDEFVFRQGVGGQLMEASIDFIEEFESDDSRESQFMRVLGIEDDDGPDVAFIQLRRNGAALASPVELSAVPAEEDEYVAVIGYPAQDSRIPEQDLMRRIFGDHYNKKRLAPGQAKRTLRGVLIHDCSTLGGNSGSVVLSLGSGKALGLHFAGRFLEANFAVPAVAVAERLERVQHGELPRRSADRPRGVAAASWSGQTSGAPGTRRKVGLTIPIHVSVSVGAAAFGDDDPTAWKKPSASSTPDDGSDDVVVTEARPEDYADRVGYESDFLGAGFETPLPTPTTDDDVLTYSLDGETQRVLDYEHFSVLMSKSRRMCRYSAVNIDGKQSRKAKRPAWRTDPRIPAGAQILKECYGNEPKFARGHMTRREDPIWGTAKAAGRGNSDSMHVTNTVPQMQPFNAGIWLGLENYALENAREDDMRICVFTGPFLRKDDPVRYGVKVPVGFWKVIAFVHDATGELSATGYRMSQEDYLREEEFVFGRHKTAQVSIASIEQQAGLSFGGLADLDPFRDTEEALPTELTDFSQIRFTR